MRLYTETIQVATRRQEELVDITEHVREHVGKSGVREGICALYSQGATAALMVQENDDPNIVLDVLDCLDKLVPSGCWRHDRIDNNADAHIKAGVVGPSETIPVRGGALGLSTWQNVFFCDFDGPRPNRRVLVTIVGE